MRPFRRAPRPNPVNRSYLVVCAVAGILSIGWATLLVFQIGGDSASQSISNIGCLLAAFAGAAGCLKAAERGDVYRRTWLFLGASCAAWGLGQLVWTWYESIGREVPFPSYADIGYLCLPPLAAIGLLVLPGATQSLAGRVRTLIDGMMIAGAVLLCSWVVVLDEVYAAGGDTFVATAISLAYPLGDVVLITIGLYVLLRTRDNRHRAFPVWIIVLGLCAFAVADSGFAYLGATGSYGSGSIIDLGWFFCFVAIMLAGLRPPPIVPEVDVEEEDTGTVGILLPYFAVGLALVTSSLEIIRTGQTDIIVSWCRTFIIAAMVVRQILTLAENRRLTRHLEDRLVELRASEQRFESLVQHSSDVVTVVDTAGSVLYQSESVERVFGYTVDDIFGKSIAALIEEGSARAFTEGLSEIAARPYEIRVLEVRVRHASGRSCLAEVTMTNLLENPSVRGIVLNTRDVTDRKMLEDQLVYSAFHDSLTTLANRALFRDRVDDTLKLGGRDGVAVLFLDLDSFKQVNDLLGHASGDLLLVQVAERLRESVRPGDTVARLGGDEFAVLLESADDAVAVDVAKRITTALRRPFTVDGHEILVRGSLGLAIASSDVRNADRLLRNADLAMYRAKAAGEGGFERYDPEMHVDLVERLQLEADLRRAVHANELILHFQPIVTLGDRRLCGAEALVRWKHPSRGLMAPSAFIPISEDSGLIVSLGQWVLHEACRQAQSWREKHKLEDFRISVNISGGQIRKGFVEQVASALEAAGLPADCLVLEMTESVLMDHSEENLGYFMALKGMGVRLAIDDFGTGYSSLSYLHRFPVDVLKIDRSFVDALGDSLSDRALVTTIVQLGRTLHMRTVAEGIETEAQAAALEEMGCEFGQGYYFSRPILGRQLEKLMGAGAVPPARLRSRSLGTVRAGNLTRRAS
jgi:diguanylate cyclase (GGDEF)-like protein/PAS domain S-box-containing protein